MTFSASEIIISQLFQASFGRAVSAKSPLQAWSDRYDSKVAGGMSDIEAQQDILREMNLSAESTVIYSTKTAEEIVDFMFSNSLGRAANEPGRSAWIARAEREDISFEQIQREILVSARSNADFDYMEQLVNDADLVINPAVAYELNSITANDDISDFSIDRDTITILALDNTITTKGDYDGDNYVAADITNSTLMALRYGDGQEGVGVPDMGLLVNTGLDSENLEVSTQVADLSNSNDSINAGDAFYYVTDDGTDTAMFYANDSNSSGTIDTGEVTQIVKLVGVADASTLTETHFNDFYIPTVIIF